MPEPCKKVNIWTQMNAHTGRLPSEDEDRDQFDTAEAKEQTLKTASKPAESGEETGDRFLPHSPQKKPILLTP